ncbi:MAG TPA: tRNA (N6-threonylcarbamoyladenosine(37)-N6)-methyltransferase TrmO [Candidatus Acidoferrum sp.]|nr:tRNA (N6-threonylcarbamoyladenosine(37)-N6)-methyltransferase TrmO [Candidatus Acidoferrum sp.]
MQPIAYIKSPYRQKFAVPRQPNLVQQAIGDICFIGDCADANCLRGLEGFSHVWLLFLFHEVQDKAWSATVTPPRLGGSERVGVFASRSPFRPNSIGLSAVEIVGVLQQGKDLRLRVRGIDLIDGTPILDIKPYVPYADAMPEAKGGFAPTAPGADSGSSVTVNFSNNSLNQIENINFKLCDLRAFITEVLSQDPRPAQHVRKGETREYGMFLYDYNVRWRATDTAMEVLSVEPIITGQEPPAWS